MPLRIYPGSPYNDLPWYKNDNLPWDQKDELDPQKDRFQEYEVMKSPFGDLTRVRKSSIYQAAYDGYTLANDKDFDDHHKGQKRKALQENAAGFMPQMAESFRRFGKGLLGVDAARWFAPVAAKLQGTTYSPEEYQEITQARSRAMPTGVGEAYEFLGMLSPLANAFKAARGVGLAGQAISRTLLAEEIAAQGATLAERTALRAGRVAQDIGKFSPMVQTLEATQPLATAIEQRTLQLLPKASKFTALTQGRSLPVRAAGLAAETAAGAARSVLPKALGSVPGATLWGGMQLADEFAFGHKPDNVSEAITSTIGGNILLFGAMEGFGGLVTGMDKAVTSGARKTYDWWRKDAPVYGESSVRAAWETHPDPLAARTAESIADRKKELLEFGESIDNGYGILVDSSPEQAAWLLDNRKALANIERQQGSGAVSRFAQCKTADGKFDVGLADHFVSNYERMANDAQSKLYAQDIRQNLLDSLEVADKMMMSVNSELIPLQKESMRNVGRPGGPPSQKGVEDAVDEVTQTIESAIKYAKDRKESHDQSSIAALYSLQEEWAQSVAKIRNTRTVKVKGQSYINEKGEIVFGKEEEQLKSDPANPELAYELLRETRTKFLQTLRQEVIARPRPTVAQKNSIQLVSDVADSLAKNIHNANSWGEYASLRATYDDAMRRYYAVIEPKTAFAESFLDHKNIDGEMRPTVTANKAMRFVDSAKNPMSYQTVRDGVTGQPSVSPIESLAEYREAFRNLIDASSAVAPSTLRVNVKGGRNAYASLVEQANKEAIDEAYEMINAAKEAGDAEAERYFLDRLRELRTGNDGLSLAEIANFAREAHVSETDMLDRLRLTGEFEDLIAAKDFRVRYEPRGHQSSLDKFASKTKVGRVVGGAFSAISDAPMYQFELEARLRQFAAGQKKAKILDQALNNWSEGLRDLVIRPGIAGAKVVSTLTPAAQRVGAAFYDYLREKVPAIESNAGAVAEAGSGKQDFDPNAWLGDGEAGGDEPEGDEATRKYLDELRYANSLANDSNALMDHIQKQAGYLQDSMPEAVAELTLITQRLAQELANASSISREQLESFTTTPERLTPTDEDMRRHRRILMASTADGLVKLIATKQLTADDVQVAERVIPGIVTKLRMQLQAELADAVKIGGVIDEEYSSSLQALLGDLPGDEQQQRRITATQTIYNKLRLGKSEKSSDNRPLPSAGKITVDDRAKTDMQRTETRRE